jgi:uncharacterized iron-regulated protein
MKKTLIILIAILTYSLTYSQVPQAFKLFSSNGKAVSMKKMLKDLEDADIILIGEYHNNPISHWIEYEVSNYLASKYDVILGAEMFEADNQENFTKYLKNEIDKEAFDTLVRLWPNYETDYSQIVLLAKRKKIDFIATNIPRRYASMVHKGGFEALNSISEDEKQWIAPLPIEFDPELPGYKKIGSMMMGHSSPNLPKAQAIKDATMAYFILQNYKPGYKFIHYNGCYHSDNYEAILWYLKRKQPELNYKTITTVTQKDVNKLYDDNKGKADFIICVDSNMTNSY